MLRPKYTFCPECLFIIFRVNGTPINPDANAKCQKCLEIGHWTYDCKQERQTYKARPTRSALLRNPNIKLPEQRREEKERLLEEERQRAAAEILEKAQRDREREERARREAELELSEFTTDEDSEAELGAEECLTNDNEKQEDHQLSSSDFSSSESEGELTSQTTTEQYTKKKRPKASEFI